MRAFVSPILRIALIFGAFAPAPLAAGQDWVALRSVRVAQPGQGQVSFGLAHSVQQSWALGDRFAFLRESNGDFKIQRRVDAQLDLAWQPSAAWGLKLGLPYHWVELSPYPVAGSSPSYRLDDASVRRTDSLGDLSLEARRAWGPDAGQAGASGALWLSVVAPTGIGPFEAQHPMAATGEGRWQIAPGLVVGASSGTWSVFAQAGAPVQMGRESSVSSEAVLGYGTDGPRLPAGGNVWLGPRYGVQGSLGLAWDWLSDEDMRQTLALEFQGWQRSPLDQGGVLTPDTEQSALGFVPQLHAHYGRFHAVAGWSLPYNYANNIASPDYGGSHLRVDYGF